MVNYGATLLTTRAHLQENQPCAILRPRLFYVLICISAQARVPGTLVHFIITVMRQILMPRQIFIKDGRYGMMTFFKSIQCGMRFRPRAYPEIKWRVGEHSSNDN